jgi:hypothetical protein
MLSTNVNQYLAFRTPQRTWWVYEWGAQVRKYKNIEKPPHEEAIIPQQDPQSSHHIQPSPRKILVLYTRLFYNTRKTLKTYNQDPPRSTRPSRIAVHT